jgi:hypothetical protein
MLAVIRHRMPIMTDAEYRDQCIETDRARWAEVIKALNISLD